MKEFNLSDRINIDINLLKQNDDLIKVKDVKEFIKLRDNQINDFQNDIIALIEINNYGKTDLLKKMKRLCIAHKKELDKLAGDKLLK